MYKDQIETNNNRKKLAQRFAETMPETAQLVGAQMQTAYKDGALDQKTKYLMAMAIALSNGCDGCILAQTEFAIESGATREEILEAIAVVGSIGGTMGISQSLKVIQFLDELGL